MIRIKMTMVILVFFSFYVFSENINTEDEVLLPYYTLIERDLQIPNKFGYIRTDGKIAIKAKYQYAQDFAEELAAVKYKGKWGFINKRDKFVVKPKYDDVESFNDSMCAVQKNDKWGFINISGKLVVEYCYEFVNNSFVNGFAIVSDENGRTFFIDKKGHECFKDKFEEIHQFSDGLAAVKYKGYWGYINENGSFQVKPIFIFAGDFSEGFAVVETVNIPGVFYIDKGGKRPFEKSFDKALGYSEGLAAVKIEDKWGFVNKKGVVVITPKYSDAYYFTEGLAGVSLFPSSVTISYINRNGTLVFESRYTRWGKFSNGIAKMEFYSAVDGPLYWVYIDKKGRCIWKADDVGVVARNNKPDYD